MIKLSVIIPGYNTPQKWWARAVDSVLAAIACAGIEEDAEVICVDDGSAEKPVFLDSYPIQVVFRQSNDGLSSARNAALAIARGEFVTFVDSDDEVCSDVFALCLSRLRETAADIALYGVTSVWPDDGLSKTDSPRRDVLPDGEMKPVSVKWLSEHCLLNYAWNKVYRLDFLRRNELAFAPAGMPFEDIEFNLRCLAARARFCFVDYAGYIYYRTRGTLLSRYKKTLEQGAVRASEAWRRYKEVYPDARLVLGDMGEVDERALKNLVWKNCWMPGSPVSLWGRWRMRPGMEFLRMCGYVFFKRFFYSRSLRRMNTRRVYPHVEEWRGFSK